MKPKFDSYFSTCEKLNPIKYANIFYDKMCNERKETLAKNRTPAKHIKQPIMNNHQSIWWYLSVIPKDSLRNCIKAKSRT